MIIFFFFNDTATTEIYTLSLHDALPILTMSERPTLVSHLMPVASPEVPQAVTLRRTTSPPPAPSRSRSEEHTSELQSRQYLVCRLLLEKKKHPITSYTPSTSSLNLVYIT